VGIGLIQDHHVGTATWPTRPVTADADVVEQRQELGIVPGLTRCEQDPHRPPPTIDSEMDLGAQTTSGSAEVLFPDGESFDGFAGAAPFFRAPAACW